jgi:hypothetical protein
VQAEIKADEVDITQPPNSDLSPFMEAVEFKVEFQGRIRSGTG